MSPGSDPTTPTLLALRLLPVADEAAVAARAGLADDECVRELAHLAAAGWARRRTGRFPGWMLTTEGRAEGERRLGDELDSVGARARTISLYEQFVVLNGEVLSVATTWQLRTVDGVDVPNDHTDARHDASVIEALGAVHRRAERLLVDLEAVVARLDQYRPRLAAALDRVRAGDREWLVRPGLDSYHTVWFELHENLLATLGRGRTDDVA